MPASERLGVPRMYVNADPDAGTAEQPGVIGGSTGRRIETRAAIMALWEAAGKDLEAAGAELVLVDVPAVTNYEGDRPGAPTIGTRGLVGPEFLHREIVDLSAWAWDAFLRANGDPELDRLTDVNAASTFPHLPEGLRGLEESRRLDVDDWMDRLGRPRLAQRRAGGQRHSRAATSRRSDGDGADGHHGRHRDAGGVDLCRARP